MEGGDQADDGGFAGARRADEGAVTLSGRGLEAHFVQDGLALLVGKADVLEEHVSAHRANG